MFNRDIKHFVWMLIVSSLQFLLNAGTVTNTSDNVHTPGSLRYELANATANETISFNIIPATGVQTITLTSGPLTFPTGVNGITIDGSTQPGTFPPGTKHIVITQSNLLDDCFDIVGNSNCTITELAINNCNDGIFIEGETGNLIQNCYLGTDASGTIPMPCVVGIALGGGGLNTVNGCSCSYNTGSGIAFAGSSNNTVANCAIASNNDTGIFLLNISTDNTIINNVIQNNSNAGIKLMNFCNSNVIGKPGNGNIITENGEGIVIQMSSFYNQIQYNSIYNNTGFATIAGLGIDLGATGMPSSNQPMNPVPDTPNESQNYPDLSYAVINCDGSLTVNYSLYSATVPQSGIANATYIIQFFSNAANRNPSNITEGQTYIGQTTVMTNGSGNASPLPYTFIPLAPVTSSDFISATATSPVTTVSPTGNTSEFSFNVPVTQGPCPALQIAKQCARKKSDCVEFVITVVNTGAIAATDVTIVDTLPHGIKFKCAYGASCTFLNGSVTANIPSLGVGQTVQFVISACECGHRKDEITNTATVTASNSPAVVPASCTLYSCKKSRRK